MCPGCHALKDEVDGTGFGAEAGSVRSGQWKPSLDKVIRMSCCLGYGHAVTVLRNTL